MDYSTILLGTYIAGLILAVTGIVKIITRKLSGIWPSGGAELVAGLIVSGIALVLMIVFAANVIISN